MHKCKQLLKTRGGNFHVLSCLADAFRWASADMPKPLPLAPAFLSPASDEIVWADIEGSEGRRGMRQRTVEHQEDQMPDRVVWEDDEKGRLWSHWQDFLFHQSALRGEIPPASPKAVRRDRGNSIYPQFLHNIVFLLLEIGRGIIFSLPWKNKAKSRIVRE